MHKLYVESSKNKVYSQQNAASSPQAMIDDVKAAFKQRLGDAEWMDAGTKRAALVKLEAITDMIGYPDYIKVGSVYKSIIRQPNQTHTRHITERRL